MKKTAAGKVIPFPKRPKSPVEHPNDQEPEVELEDTSYLYYLYDQLVQDCVEVYHGAKQLGKHDLAMRLEGALKILKQQYQQ